MKVTLSAYGYIRRSVQRWEAFPSRFFKVRT
jgi:hypothetical protein